METEIQIEGYLGSTEGQIRDSSRITRASSESIVNVHVVTNYPRTGERQNQYLLFSGICLLLIIFLLRRKKLVK